MVYDDERRDEAPEFTIYEEELSRAKPGQLRMTISLSEQHAVLYGADDEVLIETDVSTGMPGRETPAGSYTVVEKLPTKWSNLFGKYVDRETGDVVVPKAWEHEGPQPKGTVYKGVEMPLWLRLTWDGVGVHVGEFRRGVAMSGGCIRVPRPVQTLIYEKARIGMPVEIEY